MFSMPQKKAPYHKIRLQNICFIIANRVQMFSMPQKKAPNHKIRLQNICFIISNRVQMFSMPQKKPLTTKSDFKTSALSFQIESKCFLCLKKGPLRQNPSSKTSAISFQIESKCFEYLKKGPLPQNPTSKHPRYHFKSSPNVFYASKKAPYDKTRLQNIRDIISNRFQMFSMPQKRPLTTKPVFKTSALSFQIESKCFLCLKKGPLPQNPSSKHPLYHFKSSPNVFYASKKAPYHKTRLQNIRFIISNRVQMFSMPQKRPLTTKSDFKTSALSFQIESKCFLCLKKGPLRQNPTSKHPLYHFKSSPNVFYASKKAPYHKTRLQNIRVIISNRVQMFSMPQKRPLTTKSVFKTSALSFQIESKCFLCLIKGPLRQNPSSKHPLYHFKSSPNVFYASKKAPYVKIRLQNIRLIISNRVQMFSMPQKKPLTTKSDFKTSALSFQIESKCFLCLIKGPLRQNPTSKHPLYHFKSSPNVFYASKKAPYDKIRLQNIRFIISNRVQMFSMPQKRPLTTKSDFKTSALSFQIESKCFLCLKKGPLRQNPSSKHPLYHFKSSPNVFYASKKAPYDKIRLQNTLFIISNRV